MKRILALLLALCLLFCLAACGNEDTTSDITSDVSQTQSTTDTSSKNESTASSTESGTETSTSTPTNSETPSTSTKPTESSTPTTSTTSKPTDTSKPTTSTTTNPTETHTHTWGNWSIETYALVGKDGTEKRTCSGCNEIERRSTNNGALQNSFYHDYLQAYFIAIYYSGLDYPSPFATKGLFYSGDYMAFFTHGSPTGISIPVEEYYKNLNEYFALSDEIILQMKTERNNQTTYSFEKIESPNVTHTPVGYTKDSQNIYTVYYQKIGGGDRNFKVKMEYNLINGKPNKYLSIEQISAIPTNITK